MSEEKSTKQWQVDARGPNSNWPSRGYSQYIVTDTEAPVVVHGDTADEVIAKAAFIVSAVNSYAKLVDTLKEQTAELENWRILLTKHSNKEPFKTTCYNAGLRAAENRKLIARTEAEI